MKFKLNIGLIILAITVIATSCNQESSNTKVRDAKTMRLYGPEAKVHDASLAFNSIYSNHGNDAKLATIAADYLGRSRAILNLEQKSKEYKSGYIEIQYLVDNLPVDLKDINTFFSQEDKTESKGKQENVVMEFIQKDNPSIRSQHTMIAEFSPLANSEEPKVKYGFDKKGNASNGKLQIRKLKTSDFHFVGQEKVYLLGATSPLRSQEIEVYFDTQAKQYAFDNGSNEGVLDMEKLELISESNQNPIADEMKYISIINNIKAIQNKYIKSGASYKVDGATRALTNIALSQDTPIRDISKGEAIMRHNGTSLSDGKSYIKLNLVDSQIGFIVDVDGYISQYQQVVVDKEQGIVEKTILIKK